ncbi:MAG: DNA cytosine methyltransferase [Anaerolineales bacterium]|nr:DNA cytosine methyltransferase [Anaerolineales bacterium]
MTDNTLTFGSYFSGGGLADIGAIQAGFTAVFAVEGDPGNWEQSMRIADCYERNIGAHVVRAAVQDVGPATLPPVDWFHASPVCKNASVAKRDAGEQDVDMITAQATADYIAEHRPRFVTIENVWGYRKFEAWNLIAKTLTAQGYAFRVDHINMADYGVPQTRKRMWVTAVLNGNRPGLLPPTHEQDPRPSLFGAGLPRWVSWYEAIEDLIPSLPDSEFAPWQLERLPSEYRDFLMDAGNTQSNGRQKYRLSDQPSKTVTAGDGNKSRAFITEQLLECPNCGNDFYATGAGLVWECPECGHATELIGFIASQGSYGSDMPSRAADKPAHTVTANHNQAQIRAFIALGGNASSFDVRDESAPSRTVGDTGRVGNLPRAFIFNDADSKRPIRESSSPSATVVTNNTGGTSPRAFIANGTPNDHGATMTVNGQDDPIFTQTASSWRRPPRAFIATVQGEASSYLEDGSPSQAITTGHGSGKYRAFIHGRVVKLTPRAIARLQTFPDHCALPDNDRDAVTMLGNGVPCEFVRLNGVRFMEMAND